MNVSAGRRGEGITRIGVIRAGCLEEESFSTWAGLSPAALVPGMWVCSPSRSSDCVGYLFLTALRPPQIVCPACSPSPSW